MSEDSEINRPKFVVETKLDPKHQQHGWLSPQGAFITCESDKHDACAKYIINLNTDYFKEKFDKDVGELSARTLLGRAGYIKIAGAYPDFYNTSGNITTDQYKLLIKAGYEVPENLNLDPSNFLPDQKDARQKLLAKYPKEKFSDFLEKFYSDPFNGVRTTDLELGNEIFEALSSQDIQSNKIESLEKNGVVEVVWKDLGDGRIALGKEAYHHVGDSPRDYDAPWDNVTIYVNTPEYMRSRIPQEFQKKD